MDLNRNLQSRIVKVISGWPNVEKIFLFGSRSTKKSKKTSDIDLAIFGKALSDKEMSLIRDTLEEEVKTALKFDVVHFESLTKKELKEDILREGTCLYESKENPSASR